VTTSIGIVGTGPVAQALGCLLCRRGAPVVAVASRDRSRAEAAAAFMGRGVQAVGYGDLPGLAGRILVAVADQGLGLVAEALAAAGLSGGVALHTCGARGPDALAALAARGTECGVVHPLQTVMTREQGVASLSGVTFGVCAGGGAKQWANEIVVTVGGHALALDVDRLPAYHAGAVMASNALVGVLDAALAMMARAGVEGPDAARALGPLVHTTVENTLANGPVAALTGPVVRGDAATVAAHVAVLRDMPPTVGALYTAAARRLIDIASARGLAGAGRRAVELALEG